MPFNQLSFHWTILIALFICSSLISCVPVNKKAGSLIVLPSNVQVDSTSRDGRIILTSFPPDTVFSAEFNVLAKTHFPAKTLIQGVEVKQYQTGIFFQTLSLSEGLNEISISASFPDGSSSEYNRKIWFLRRNFARPAFPLWIDTASITPKLSWQGTSNDRLDFSFKGSKGQHATLVIQPGNLRHKMIRSDFADYSLYSTDLFLDKLKVGKTSRALLILNGKHKILRMKMPGTLNVAKISDYPLLRTTSDQTPVTWNLGPIRLGGPLIGEFPKGIIFQSTGKTGNFFRIRLDSQREGVVPASAVEVLPTETPRPGYFLQSVSALPSSAADIVRIPWPEPIPYTIETVPPGKALRIRLYGVQTSSTWMTHKSGLRMVELISWEQITPETYEILVHLKSPILWGYSIQPDGKNLVLRINYPPTLPFASSTQPWNGLKLSIEAGHGGWNTGAVGLSGLLEKDVNLDVSLRLADLCRNAGMEILQVRPDDTYLSLEDKRKSVQNFCPHLHLSIHANSGGGGFLGANGVSTYYHDVISQPFAQMVYQELLQLPLREFGVVGSFNYHVTRMTTQPSILVELAFLSHAEDEEKLASAQFRQQLAEQIFQGIQKYLHKYLNP